MKKDALNKLIVHPAFKDTILDIKKQNIQLPPKPTNQDLDLNLYGYPSDGVLSLLEKKDKPIRLNPNAGLKVIEKEQTPLSAYDESINKFSSLEGTAFLTSHSLVVLRAEDYVPINLLTLYFYTRSNVYSHDSSFIKYSIDPESDSKRDYAIDRSEFISNNTPPNSIVFIDGPLIGGQVSSYTTKLNHELLKKNVIPIFFVKNSTSNLVTEYYEKFKGKYNSDLHWAHQMLRGYRTPFFKYIDQKNVTNGKIFCYLKAFDVSPQRIELHTETYKKYGDTLISYMDLVYYLLLVQGTPSNPQIRPIAIAEKYARSTLGLIDLTSVMRGTGIIPTMNQERFGW